MVKQKKTEPAPVDPVEDDVFDDESDDAELEDEEFEDDFEEEEDDAVFRCPICEEADGSCDHLLGSRDVHFAGSFCVDENGVLHKLDEPFSKLGVAVTALVDSKPTKKVLVAIKPPRLRLLVEAVAAGAEFTGFADYIERIGNDTEHRVIRSSYTDDVGPGFTSKVYLYWTKDVKAVLKGIMKLLREDISGLKALR